MTKLIYSLLLASFVFMGHLTPTKADHKIVLTQDTNYDRDFWDPRSKRP